MVAVYLLYVYFFTLGKKALQYMPFQNYLPSGQILAQSYQNYKIIMVNVIKIKSKDTETTSF